MTKLNVILLIVVLALGGAAFWAYREFRQGDIDPFGSAVRGPKTIHDTSVAINAGNGWQALPFSLVTPREVLIEVTGEAHTAKGFDVFVIRAENMDTFRSGQDFHHVSKFQGLSAVNYKESHSLPAGTFYAVVVNSNNILNTMTVHVRVVTDP
ncbi:MAG: hypothetical protein OEY28_00140 [Nitrospira sp.]|nr:hypothetical protein [Nitrospira sp.]